MINGSVGAGLHGDHQWWNVETRQGAPHELLVALVDRLWSRQTVMRNNTRRLISIFQWGFRAAEGQAADNTEVALDESTNTYNAAQNCIEVMHAKICRTGIIPMPLTEGEGYIEQNRARDLGHALEGEFAENDVERIKEDVATDFLVTGHGAGAAHVFNEGGKVKIEHLPIEDITFDETETRYRKPRCMFIRWRMDRFQALAKYGKKDSALFGSAEERRAIIRAAPQAKEDGRAAVDTDQIDIHVAYHLPSSPVTAEDYEDAEVDGEDGTKTTKKVAKHDGRVCIAVSTGTIMDAEWKRDHFPVAMAVPRRRPRSIWGMSTLYDLAPTQHEYEKITRRIQLANHRIGGTHIYANRDANIKIRELDNSQGTVIEGDGPNPPQAFNPEPVAPQTYEYQASLPRDMKLTKGISELSASSQLPAGMQQASGKALTVFEDFESERLLPYTKELDRWVVALSWLVVEEVSDLLESGEKYSSMYRSNKGLKPIEWAEVLRDKENLRIVVFPINSLSKQPAAKFAQLTEMLNSGAITVEQFKRLYGFPDLENELELDEADTNIIDRSLEKMALGGKYISPQGFDDLALYIKRAGKFINLMRLRDLPEDRMTLLHSAVADAKSIDAEAKAAAAANQNAAPQGAAPPPGGPPPMGGMPGAPPEGPLPGMPQAPPMAA